MLLSKPLKLDVLRNEPLKGRTWDVPLTIESDFTRPDRLMSSECNPFAVPRALCVNVCLYFPAPLTVPAISAWMSLTSLLSSVSHTVSFSPAFSLLAAFSSSFACTLSPSPHLLRSHHSSIQCSCHIIKTGVVTLGFTFTSLPPNLSDQMPLEDICF